jgi:hypothetical protein
MTVKEAGAAIACGANAGPTFFDASRHHTVEGICSSFDRIKTSALSTTLSSPRLLVVGPRVKEV